MLDGLIAVDDVSGEVEEMKIEERSEPVGDGGGETTDLCRKEERCVQVEVRWKGEGTREKERLHSPNPLSFVNLMMEFHLGTFALGFGGAWIESRVRREVSFVPVLLPPRTLGESMNDD